MKRSRNTFEQQEESKEERVTTWDNLNHDVLRCIALWLPYGTLMAYVNVCRKTARTITDDKFWQEKIYHDFSPEFISSLEVSPFSQMASSDQSDRRMYITYYLAQMMKRISVIDFERGKAQVTNRDLNLYLFRYHKQCLDTPESVDCDCTSIRRNIARLDEEVASYLPELKWLHDEIKLVTQDRYSPVASPRRVIDNADNSYPTR